MATEREPTSTPSLAEGSAENPVIRTMEGQSAKNTLLLVEGTISNPIDLTIDSEEPAITKGEHSSQKSISLDLAPFATFHPFPKLPIEIRLYIWALAASIPRTVFAGLGIEYATGKSADRVTFHDYTVPGILHTNSEARSEARKFYTLNESMYTKAPIWMNYQHDTLFLLYNGFTQYLFSNAPQLPGQDIKNSTMMEGLRYLALPAAGCLVARPYDVRTILMRCPQLEQILVYDPTFDASDEMVQSFNFALDCLEVEILRLDPACDPHDLASPSFKCVNGVGSGDFLQYQRIRANLPHLIK